MNNFKKVKIINDLFVSCASLQRFRDAKMDDELMNEIQDIIKPYEIPNINDEELEQIADKLISLKVKYLHAAMVAHDDIFERDE